MAAKKDKEPEIKFEKSLEELESIVDELEGGNIDLDAALKKFETGVKLTGALQKKLEDSQRKVKKLIADGRGGVIEEDFENDGKESSGELF